MSVDVLLFAYLRRCLAVGGGASWQRCSTLMGCHAVAVMDVGWGLDPTLLMLIPALVGLVG